MNNSPHKVAIVVDPDFGKPLLQLAKRLHVWVIESSTNLIVVKEIWNQADSQKENSFEEDPLLAGVTTFRPAPHSFPEDTFLNILETVDEHHGEWSHDPPWSVIEVYGVKLTKSIKHSLSECGVDCFEETAEGFSCSRP